MGVEIYESDPDAAPDAAYVSGGLARLVVGNGGRFLDRRRTPVTITAVDGARAQFAVRLDAFEDAGAHWELPLEDVERFQFPPSAEILAPEGWRRWSAHARGSIA